MAKEIKVYIEDILESITKIKAYTLTLASDDSFYENSQLQDAVIRRLEIMGEAAKSIPQEFRQKYSDIPWKQIAGLRDVLIHEYFGINLKRVLKVIKEELPLLENKLKVVKKDLP